MRNDIQRRIRRSKDCERRTGKWLLEHDGPDPRFIPGQGIATATGRVGHITAMQIDCISMTYACEVKQVKVWAGLWKFWKQIVVMAARQGKEPMMKFEPTNEDSSGVPNFHIITESRHGELLDIERQWRAEHGEKTYGRR